MKTYDPKKMKIIFSFSNNLIGEINSETKETFDVDVASKSDRSGSISLTLSSDEPPSKALKRLLMKEKPRKFFYKKKKYKWYR